MPSLTRLSPSISETMRRGAPSRDVISVAASASVGETIAPSVNATAHGSPIHSCATTATAAIVAADETEREQRDRPLVRAQVAQRREERARVQERRKHGDEHDVRRKRDVRQPGDEAHHDPAQHEQDRQRQPQRRREREERADRDEQPEKLEILVRAELHTSNSSSHAGRGAHRTVPVLVLVAVVEPGLLGWVRCESENHAGE